MLILDLTPGQTVMIGENISLTVKKKTGQVCRIAINAHKSVPIRQLDAGKGGDKRIAVNSAEVIK